MTSDELDEFYRLTGAALWHVQYLEDVLVNFLAATLLQARRDAGETVTPEDGDTVISEARITT